MKAVQVASDAEICFQREQVGDTCGDGDGIVYLCSNLEWVLAPPLGPPSFFFEDLLDKMIPIPQYPEKYSSVPDSW